MKKLVRAYEGKKEEVASLELRRDTLMKEEITFQSKLIENKRILLESEFFELDLLRRVWSRKQMNEASDLLEAVESGWVPNQCNPPDYHGIGGELDVLRIRVDEALKGIYPSKEVEDMRATTERLRNAVKNITDLIERVRLELEDVIIKISAAKKELSKLEESIWFEIYEGIKKDVQKTVLPIINRAFVAINGYNPYAVRYGDHNFYIDLLGVYASKKGFPIEDILKQREEMRKEFFKV